MLDIASLIVLIISCLSISIFYALDTFRRISKERKRRAQNVGRFWPIPTWWRITLDYVTFILVLIVLFFLGSAQKDDETVEYLTYVVSWLITLLLQCDWYQLEIETGYVRKMYQSLEDLSHCNDHWAKWKCVMGSIMLITVNVGFCIPSIHSEFPLSLFIPIQIGISLLITSIIGCYFYHHTRHGHLNGRFAARINPGSYRNWLERFWYHAVYLWIRIICHVVLLVLSVYNVLTFNEHDADRNVRDYGCIICGFTLQFWMFGYYYLFKTNRCALNCRFCILCNRFWEYYASNSYKTSKEIAMRNPSTNALEITGTAQTDNVKAVKT